MCFFHPFHSFKNTYGIQSQCCNRYSKMNYINKKFPRTFQTISNLSPLPGLDFESVSFCNQSQKSKTTHILKAHSFCITKSGQFWMQEFNQYLVNTSATANKIHTFICTRKSLRCSLNAGIS